MYECLGVWELIGLGLALAVAVGFSFIAGMVFVMILEG